MSSQRLVVLALVCSLVLGTASQALALNRVQLANRHERILTRRLAALRKHSRKGEFKLIKEIALTRRSLAWPLPAPPSDLRRPILTNSEGLVRKLAWLQQNLQAGKHRTASQVKRLLKARAEVRAWLRRFGVFSVCPVRGPHLIENNFGVIVRLPHVPVHVHQGDDIVAPVGAPVVAPFDGYASMDNSVLGGMGVKVTGKRGYVFQAHLEAFGQLGWVKAGTVVGYVGATGDARGPHDHFEWHPGGGAAVDPYPFLSAVCG